MCSVSFTEYLYNLISVINIHDFKNPRLRQSSRERYIGGPVPARKPGERREMTGKVERREP